MEPADLIQPGDARRLAQAREASGIDPGHLASMLGITYEAYRDLEDFDEEMVDALSFDQLVTLAGAIALDLRALFVADAVGETTFAELAARVEALAATEPGGVAAVEDAVGWELGKQLDDPSTFGELPLVALADVGEAVRVDWRSLLPAPASRS